MSAPAISVVIPCYNCETTLARCVRSVLTQSFTDFEILLVDDGSRDATLVLALALATKDARIRVLTQINAGVAQTRNRGVAQARGRLIAFLDADDWWERDKLAAHCQLHDSAEQPDASFAGIVFVPDGPSKALARSTVPHGGLTILQVLGENPVCTMSNLVVRRDAFARFGLFDTAMSHAEDQEWLARLVVGGARVLGINRQLVCYRTSQSGLSADLESMYAGWRSFAYAYASTGTARRCEAVFCRYLARRALRLPHSPLSPLHYALRGLRLDAASFLSDPRRGLATAMASLLAVLLPDMLRMKIFA
jgi:glycosyltransferase involved in cell wall biosynthesis